jgi:2,4-dienoyl-CoA reductase-like NADH-dependent reductase (Old Yellow Enzyme family)
VAWGPSNKYLIGNPESAVVPTEVYEQLVEDFAQAARRAREAGFDFVSFHFCHGSLPHTNLSLLSNQGRTDKYADHFLFCEEIIKRTQALCGADYPLVPRLCCDENLEGGYDIEYFAENYAPRLHALGISVLDCTFGSMLGAPSRRPDIHSTEFIGPSFYTPKVINLANIQKLKRLLVEKSIDMPLIGSANLISPDDLRRMVDDGGADRRVVSLRCGDLMQRDRRGQALPRGVIGDRRLDGPQSPQDPPFGIGQGRPALHVPRVLAQHLWLAQLSIVVWFEVDNILVEALVHQ